MRIGEVTKENYMDFMRIFSNGKNVKPLVNDKEKDTDVKPFDPSEGIEPGMDITGRSDWKKIVPVSDDIKNEILNIVKNAYINHNGISDGEEYRTIANKYIMSVSANERASVAWTLDQISIDEGRRIGAFIKESNPKWQHGQSFDYSILDNYVSGGIDIKA